MTVINLPPLRPPRHFEPDRRLRRRINRRAHELARTLERWAAERFKRDMLAELAEISEGACSPGELEAAIAAFRPRGPT